MIRIVHLLDSQADFQTRRSVELLARGLGDGYFVDVKRIGRSAEQSGDFRSVTDAIRGLRREDRETIVHAWGAKPLAAAAMGTRGRIVYSPIEFFGKNGLAWLRAVMNYRDVQVICATATQRKTAVERGVALERCHLVRPGVDFGRVKSRRDPALRAALGFSEDDHVMLAVGESTRAAAHDLLVWSASILHVLDRKHKVLLWGRGSRAAQALRTATEMNYPELARMATQRLGRAVDFEELLPAVDTLLVTATGPVATMPIAIAMASALPIVATVTYTVAELLEDRHTAVMASQPTARMIAQRIQDLRADSRLQWSIADMARNEAYAYFAQTRFIEQYRSAYRQIAAGSRVEIAEPAAPAGLRFHGRG